MLNMININKAIMTVLDVHLPYKGYNTIAGFNKNTNDIWLFGALSNTSSNFHYFNNVITYNIDTNIITNKVAINPPIWYSSYGGNSVQFNNNIYFLYGYNVGIGLYKFDMDTATYSIVNEANNKFPNLNLLTICNNENEYPNIIFGLYSHSIFNYFGYYNFSNSLWTNASGNTLFSNEHYMGNCVVKNGYLYAIGGSSNIIDKVNVKGIFGIETIQIQSYPILPDAHNAEASVISYLNYIFIIGGYHNEKYNISFSKSITVYNIDNNNIYWYDNIIPIALSKVTSVGVYVYEDKMYLFGGYNAYSSYDTIITANIFDL